MKRDIDVNEVDAIARPVPLVSKGLTTRDAATGELREGEDQNPIVAFLLPGGMLVLMFMLILLGAAPLLQGVIEEKMQRIAEVLLGSVQPFALMIGKLIGMDPAIVRENVTGVYQRKGEKIVDLNIRAIEAGEAYVEKHFAEWPSGYVLEARPDGDVAVPGEQRGHQRQQRFEQFDVFRRIDAVLAAGKNGDRSG